MALTTALWKVDGGQLAELPKTQLNSEKRLEDWIEQDSAILDMQLLFVGRQVSTDAGPIDLLALDGDANTVILELKRDKTPREVVAQALDYASCVKEMSGAHIESVFANYLKNAGQSLSDAFRARFGSSLPDSINLSHSMVIVASRLDDSSERIVKYLQADGININVVFFNVFTADQMEVLARSWLTDPEQAAEQVEKRNNGPKPLWSGYWYVNVGEGAHRDWDDCRKYGFLSAGVGRKWSDPLFNLSVGDEVFAYLKGQGYVGYGVVRQEAVMVKDFIVEETSERLLNMPLRQLGIAQHKDDPDLSDYAVKIEWRKTFDKSAAQTFPNIFANPNIVCKLRNPATVDFLKDRFEVTNTIAPGL